MVEKFNPVDISQLLEDECGVQGGVHLHRLEEARDPEKDLDVLGTSLNANNPEDQYLLVAGHIQRLGVHYNIRVPKILGALEFAAMTVRVNERWMPEIVAFFDHDRINTYRELREGSCPQLYLARFERQDNEHKTGTFVIQPDDEAVATVVQEYKARIEHAAVA